MKKIIAIILSIAVLCGSFVFIADAASYSTGSYTVNTSSGVNVRSGAGTSYSKVGAATNGTKFSVSKTSGSWGYTSSIKCTNGTKSGWVSLDYCKYNSTSSKTYYTLTYNANGGSGAPASQKVEKGKTFKISKTIPTRSGYSFLGWGAKNATIATISPNHEVTMSSNCTIYAVWASGSVKSSYSEPLTDSFCYYISPACATNSVLDVSSAGKNSNTNIQIWNNYYAKNQRWQAKKYGSGYYYFIDYNSGLVLDVHGGLALNGINVSTWTFNGSDAQLFRLISAGGGYYYIQSKINPAYYLDISGANSSNGTNVQLYRGNNSSAQKFKFTPVYNVNEAVKYAQTWTDNSGKIKEAGKYNSSIYNVYLPTDSKIVKFFSKYDGYDCTNYVSQCLLAGGLNTTTSWSPVYKGKSIDSVKGGITWVRPGELFPYLKNQGFESEAVKKDFSNIYKGDIIFLVSTSDNIAHHAMICTGKSDGMPIYCCHSTWTKDKKCYSGLFNQYGAVYVVHMSGMGTFKIKK